MKLPLLLALIGFCVADISVKFVRGTAFLADVKAVNGDYFTEGLSNCSNVGVGCECNYKGNPGKFCVSVVSWYPPKVLN